MLQLTLRVGAEVASRTEAARRILRGSEVQCERVQAWEVPPGALIDHRTSYTEVVEDRSGESGGRRASWPEALRRALVREDFEAFLDLVGDALPGTPGGATRANYISSVRRYLKWTQVEFRSVLNATREDAEAYRVHLLADHAHAPATVHNHLARVRKLYGVLVDGGAHEGPNPFENLKLPTHHAEEFRDVYSGEEVGRLLEHADAEKRALVLLGAHGGLSAPEIVHLRWEDVVLIEGRVRLSGREVEASDELHRALTAFGKARGHTVLFGTTGRVFDFPAPREVRAALYWLCRRANVTYRAWHALRHHAALRAAERTGSAEEAARFLGLVQARNVQTTKKAAEKH